MVGAADHGSECSVSGAAGGADQTGTSGSGPGSSWSRRPISLAVDNGWPVRTVITMRTGRCPAGRRAAAAARRGAGGDGRRAAGGARRKDETAPELIAVLELPADDLEQDRGSAGLSGRGLRPADRTGNIGSIIRSADAFGAHGVIVTGHAADVYDPKAVRATTGSLFAVPAVRVPSHREVLDWYDAPPYRSLSWAPMSTGRSTCSTSTSPGRAAPDRQRDPWPERSLERSRGPAGPNPHHRLGQLAERRQRSNRRPTRSPASVPIRSRRLGAAF